MNKKAILTVALIIVAVAIAYFFFAKKPVVAPTLSPSSSPEQISSSTLRDLISKGISQSCTYSTDKSYGTIYLDSGKIRGDFNITTGETNDETTVSHMIIMNNTSYLWTEGSKTGVKMAFDQNATPAPITSNTPTNSFDADALNNYKCSVWMVDSSKFDLPAGIQFSSLTISKQCSACDSLSGDDKTQCLTALKCK